MCGIFGQVALTHDVLRNPETALALMDGLLAHRGPDARGTWISQDRRTALGHRRLSIIDLSDAARQPMAAASGSTITYNGEIYNYRELRRSLGSRWTFRSESDTEVVLAAYEANGTSFVDSLRGMFALAIWDGRRHRLICARDRFGVKPFYYCVTDQTLTFASEAKALLPFLGTIETDRQGLAEYLMFQHTIGSTTLFKGIKSLRPGHLLIVEGGFVREERYWDVQYEARSDLSEEEASENLRFLLSESVDLHLRSDVEVGTYLSGGLDSTLLATLSGSRTPQAFHGRFLSPPGYDESAYALVAAKASGSALHIEDISSEDLTRDLQTIVYHLDYPVAGPGALPQFVVSRLAASKVKVVLGGQGGDEIFGGYARYLLAYLEQCIKAAIDGTYKDGHFVVTLESIIPNLGLLREYKPLIRKFWQKGLFESLDRRYLRLIDRSTDLTDEIDWSSCDMEAAASRFFEIFNSRRNVGARAYFDSMTHYDLKTLLPALLQVEDRVSMAHGLESRVPFLDHLLVEFAATIPANVKFKGGEAKHILKRAFAGIVPHEIQQRRDKMGFPVPLSEWASGDLSEYVRDIFADGRTRNRDYINAGAVSGDISAAEQFSRKLWALLCLELWHRSFHDRSEKFVRLNSFGPERANEAALEMKV